MHGALMRRIVIGALVAAAAIAWLAVELGMNPQVLMHYALTSLLLVLAMAVLALAGAGLLRLLGRLRGRRQSAQGVASQRRPVRKRPKRGA